MRPDRAQRFSYGGLDIDEADGVLRCHYDLDGQAFVETVRVGAGHRWTDASRAAARLVHLLAGVSYYKAGAARTIDLRDTPVLPGEADLLRTFYREGLGEFAHRNGLSLDDVDVVGGVPTEATVAAVDPRRALVPFGGGIDSLVSVDVTTRALDDVALFVANRAGDPFEAIERAATATGLPVRRAERELDPRLLRPEDPTAVFNGHVPITGVLSAIAVLVAVLDGRGLVVMSNEWSASKGNLEVGGRVVNHQWSKSAAFEDAFRDVLAHALGPDLQWFSLLRARSEVWVAERFAALPQFHHVVHSCNRAFHLDPAQRLDHWCGRCDKCCFIDLVLSPFLPAAELERLFAGAEPLADATLLPQLRALLGLGDERKPFECVGDVDECRTAAALAAARPDRAGNPVLHALLAELGPATPRPPTRSGCSSPSAPTTSPMPSSPPLTWADLRDARVGVWGVGIEGRATLARLSDLGVEPAAVVDDRPETVRALLGDALLGTAVLATDAGGLDALAGCQVVVKSQGISRYGEAALALGAAGVAVVGGLGLWLEDVGPDRVVGITGTKGKSTTTSVVHHLAQGLGVRSCAGGNLGTALWAPDVPTEVDLFVVEVSSHQATDLWSSPAVAAVTSLHPDHLTWHGSVERYYADKLSLCGRPGAADHGGQRHGRAPAGPRRRAAARPPLGRPRHRRRVVGGPARAAGPAQRHQRADRRRLPPGDGDRRRGRPGPAVGRGRRLRAPPPPARDHRRRRRCRVRRRLAVDQRAPDHRCGGGVRRPAAGPSGRRLRARHRLRAPRRLRGCATRTDPGVHAADERRAHPAGRRRGGGRRRRLRGPGRGGAGRLGVDPGWGRRPAVARRGQLRRLHELPGPVRGVRGAGGRAGRRGRVIERTHPNGVRTVHFDAAFQADLDAGDPSLLAAVTTRHGGLSTGAYGGCNLAFHVGDDPAAVLANRALVCEALGVAQLTVADQQHGRTVAAIDDDLAGAGHLSLADAEARLGAVDGLVTDRPGVALAVLVADCAPVVLHDPVRRALGVAHVGRRGAVLDVVGATVTTMAERFGSDPHDLVAGIGPCIAAAGYELGGVELEETAATFDPGLFGPTRPGHATFDLRAAVRFRLLAAGVAAGVAEDNIEFADFDTRTGTDTWFSHRAERPCGRFALIASLR